MCDPQFGATHDKQWQFWIDRGGTFTDIVARSAEGELKTCKLLSENQEQYCDAALAGIRRVLGVASSQAVPAHLIAHVKMGTTIATNALLERKGERVALVITKGFADALRIGYQNRPRLFDLNIQLPEMLYETVIEAQERMGANGEIIEKLDEAVLTAELRRVYLQDIRAVAIVFMHGYRFHAHELTAARIAKDIGFTQISVSHQAGPLIKLVSRGDTTVMDAYLSPILRRYVNRIASTLGDTQLLFMQSSGGLTQADRFQGKDSILSGPAGGVVGMVRTAVQAGFSKVIGFDMGGTSTDVSHYDGSFERVYDGQVAGVRIRAPMMAIHTVAAGGGSIVHFDGSRFRVGPDSAGANPGPACYRRGGPLTVTDCNVMLGKIQPDFFPYIFGPDANAPLDAAIVRKKFAQLASEITAASGKDFTSEQVAEGFLRIAVENMANAIKKISVEKGHDITRYALNGFGGAAGQHVCLVADALGMESIVIHPLAGVLSAYGMGLANITAIQAETVEAALDAQTLQAVSQTLDRLAQLAQDEVVNQGIAPEKVTLIKKIDLRYQGTDTALTVLFAPLAQLQADFAGLHQHQFGFIQPDRSLVIATISVEAIGATADTEGDRRVCVDPKTDTDDRTQPAGTVCMISGGKNHAVSVYMSGQLQTDNVIRGPAIISDANATIVIEPGWQVGRRINGELILTRHEPRPQRNSIGTKADPVMLEVFNNLFMSIAEQMGATLANTASSVNIKERLDFSCAIFDRSGSLVANAPHMPVHLGSMGESVKAVIAGHAGMKPGDVFAINAPYNGGTHLPDVTVVTPVFDEQRSQVIFYVASRGHHADLGGITPGSMPPDSTTVEEEGILFDNLQIVRNHQLLREEIHQLLTGGPYPARNPGQNIADLGAQIAANEKGVQELIHMAGHFGLDVVQAYMQHVQDNAEETVRRVLDVLSDGEFVYEMDDGSIICVAVRIDRQARKAVVDFTGTAAQRPNNFNAPLPVCRAAVLYVFRTLVNDDIPLNAGCLKPIEIIAPAGCMLNPQYPAAVVAGNVETSQCVTDALYGALGVMAAAQGTMNNFTFGNDQYQYYETICGGAGAGPGFDGQSAVHTHMTNSRLTDPEVLESRYPVRLESFSIRPNSGGKGRYTGGNGVIRRIRFNEAMHAAILSNHRRIAPFGLQGGQPGKPGRNWVERSNGVVEALDSTASVQLEAEDVVVIETPGGGGYGCKR
ncbi:5-oxoprolinase (ATP-hydrolysing) [Nitrosomonas sp. Nm51]|uniref:hydantoinase B/oxoprolinase family protein n=1 Tax=Nitrosomonas sp. Nm51 TaxID=133720 RepID=UPI0008C947BF|nr:hydantoinase B/oxoprolinase family protein [Nitrosomonas sp. Nm51]SER52457.1 5-oxoprolinase (ATP-hydrolysing) [Nitrosomonas sp. Nm51]